MYPSRHDKQRRSRQPSVLFLHLGKEEQRVLKIAHEAERSARRPPKTGFNLLGSPGHGQPAECGAA